MPRKGEVEAQRVRMKAVDFYKLPRAIQDRFVGSVMSGFPPAPLLAVKGAASTKMVSFKPGNAARGVLERTRRAHEMSPFGASKLNITGSGMERLRKP